MNLTTQLYIAPSAGVEKASLAAHDKARPPESYATEHIAPGLNNPRTPRRSINNPNPNVHRRFQQPKSRVVGTQVPTGEQTTRRDVHMWHERPVSYP